jgi:hypothetical protein
MAICAVRAMLRSKLMISAYIIALVVQCTMARGAAAQSVTGQPVPPMDRQREIALALSACPAPLAEKAGVYVLEASGEAWPSQMQAKLLLVPTMGFPQIARLTDEPQHERLATRSIVTERPRRGADVSPRHPLFRAISVRSRSPRASQSRATPRGRGCTTPALHERWRTQ